MFDKSILCEAELDVTSQVKIRPSYLKYQKENEGMILSPFFNLAKQQFVDPLHLSELIDEVNFSTKIPTFESKFICRRLAA